MLLKGSFLHRPCHVSKGSIGTGVACGKQAHAHQSEVQTHVEHGVPQPPLRAAVCLQLVVQRCHCIAHMRAVLCAFQVSKSTVVMVEAKLKTRKVRGTRRSKRA